jgi:iron complex transport system ATP-binding protein
MTMDDLSTIIADVSDISGYFHLYTGRADAAWRPLDEFLGDHRAFAQRVTAAAELFETEERRVAASILHLGIAARLWAPFIGAAVLHGTLLEWASHDIEWKPFPGGPLPLRLPAPSGQPITALSSAPEPIYRAMTLLLEPLNSLIQSTVKIAPRLLWGNGASALGGAVLAIARARPERAAEATALGNTLLDLGHLRDTGRFTEPVPGRPFFTRTTCCLYYRIPGAGKCGDCALISPETRQAQWSRALQESP